LWLVAVASLGLVAVEDVVVLERVAMVLSHTSGLEIGNKVRALFGRWRRERGLSGTL
jgi:hypothetical protein